MTSITIGRRIADLPRSGVRSVMEQAARRPDAIRLDIGDPDFPTPAHIVEALYDAARSGFTHYGPAAGLPSLREAIADRLVSRFAVAADPAGIVVTVGGCGGLYATLMTLLDPGDEVCVPDPAWSNYLPIALGLGLVPVSYRLSREDGFRPDFDSLRSVVTPRTRAVIINSPANPTGAVLGRDDLGTLIEWTVEHDLFVVSDECYDEILFEGEHVTARALADSDHVVSVFSFSKTYAMTGWRLGYVSATPPVAALVTRAQEVMLSCPSTPVQRAGEAALTGPPEPVAAMRDAYRRRRDAVCAALDTHGIAHFRPGGAFYVMPDISPSGLGSAEFADVLLREHAVAVIPGIAFGPRGEGLVRVSLAARDDALADGIDRLAALVHEREAWS